MGKRDKNKEDVENHIPIYKSEEYKNFYNNVISTDIDDEEDDYNAFLQERKNMLPETKEKREQIEAEIKLQVLKIWNEAKADAQSDDENIGFYKYRPFLEIEHVKEYFRIFGTVGDRNIGKSYSSREEADRVNEQGERWMILRNIDDEVEAQLTGDLGDGGWLNDRNYIHEGKLKSPTIVSKETGETVGYYRPVNTSSKFKSVEFPNTTLMIYEEFPEGNVKNKFFKMVKLMSTVLRFNKNGKLLLQANYTDQYDDILQSIGLGSKKMTAEDFIHFNWEIGAIIIFIPKGIYRKPNTNIDIAYRASLGRFDVWKNQYGGGFQTEEPVNIINESEIVAVEPQFNIYNLNSTLRTANKSYGAFKMTLYHAYDSNGNVYNVITDQQVPNDKPVFIFDVLNKVQYPHAKLMEINALENLLHHWNSGNLKTTNLEVHAKICALFANALKFLLKDDGNIDEIENLVV